MKISGHSSKTNIDFAMILLLFLSGRVMLLLAFPPENLIFYSDYHYYFAVADLSRLGFYPYLDYWQAYPPIFIYLNLAVYTLADQQLKNHTLLLAGLLLLVDGANLYLLYRLALILRGLKRAIQTAWIYTALFIPTFFLLNSFEALTTFFILLSLYALIKKKHKTLALAIGLGAMVKVVPVLLGATVWRMCGLRTALIYGATTLLISLLLIGPFALLNPTMTYASIMSQPSKSSYETVWALIDGNYTTGNFGPITDHFDPAKATELVNNPARIPSLLRFLPFALLGLFILTRPRRLPSAETDAVIFTALTLVIFFLWSPGWSPQWQMFLLPLLLLILPERRAILFILVLGFINFLEWPVILSRGLTNLLPLTIIARTLIFVLLGVELYKMLNPKDEPDDHLNLVESSETIPSSDSKSQRETNFAKQ